MSRAPLLFAILLCIAVSAYFTAVSLSAHDARVCVSAIGPVNANGEGSTIPIVSGDCP